MVLESVDLSTQCPCCEVTTECDALRDFQKIIELPDAGLVVYRHKPTNDELETNELSDAQNIDQDIFIVHNTKDVEIKSVNFSPEIEQNDVSCPRCRYIIEHAQRLLQNMSVSDQKDIIAICDYCRKENRSRQTFCKCQEIANKFAASILKYKDGDTEKKHKMKTSEEIKSLLNKALMVNMDSEKVKSHSIFDLTVPKYSPISVHAPEVDYMFEPSSLTIDKHLTKDEAQAKKVLKKRDSKPTVRVDIDSDFKQKPPKGALYVKTDEVASVMYSDEELKPCLVKPRHHADEPLLTDEKELELEKPEEILKHPSKESFLTAITTLKLSKKSFTYIFPTNIEKERSQKKATKTHVSSSELIKNIHEKIEKQEILKKEEKERKRIHQAEEKKRKHEERIIKREEKDRKRREYEKQQEEQEAEKRALSEKQSKTSRLQPKTSKVDRDTLATDKSLKGQDKTKSITQKQSTVEQPLDKTTSKRLKEEKQQMGKDEKETEKKGLKEKQTEVKEKERRDKDASKEKDVKQTGKERIEKDKKEQKISDDEKNKQKTIDEKEPKKTSKKENEADLIKKKGDDAKKQEDMKKSKESAEKAPERTKESKDVKSTPSLKEKDEKGSPKDKGTPKDKGSPKDIGTPKDIGSPKDKGSAKDKAKAGQSQEDKQKMTDTQSKKEPKDKSTSNEADVLKKTLAAQAKDKDEKEKAKKTQDEAAKKANEAADKAEQQIKSKVTESEDKAQKTKPKAGTQAEKEKGGKEKSTTESKKEPKGKSKDNEAEFLKKALATQAKDKDDSEKAQKLLDEALKKATEAADKAEQDIKSKGTEKEGKVQKITPKSDTQPEKKKSGKEEAPTKKDKDLKATDIKMKEPSGDDLMAKLVKMKREERKEKPKEKLQPISVPIPPKIRKKKTPAAVVCNMSDLELDLESSKYKKKKPIEVGELILRQEIVKKRLGLIEKYVKIPEVKFAEETHIPSQVAPEKAIIEPEEPPKGVIRFTLSDRRFIDRGWTVLPCEKVVRKMNIYRMRQSKPEFDWFERNKRKGSMFYDSGERMAEFQDDGRCRWYYKNGKLALDYYDTADANAQKRIVVYSNGEGDERDRARQSTVLATFDYLGNGMVFDNNGKVRFKYNQTEGIVQDREIGPASTWKWHSLNDPPVLQQVMIDTQLDRKDAEIMKIGTDDAKKRPDNEEMLAIEFENFIKLKSKKILSQKFQPFQIMMKAFKINENFSLRVMDQSTIYLVFREGSTNVKLNIGMKLDHTEIVDTDTSDMGQVTINVEDRPARTDSIAELQRRVGLAQQADRFQNEHERRLLGVPLHTLSIDKLTAAITKPLRLPLQTIPPHSTTSREICYPI